MKRYLFFIFLMLEVFFASGRNGDLQFHKYADKYHFVDSIYRTFNKNNNHIAATKDSIEKLAEKNDDIELALEIRLFQLKDIYGNQNLPFAEHEAKILQVISEATDRKLVYIKADALQDLGNLYYVNDHFAHGLESFLSSYIIYSNFSYSEFPQKQAYLFFLGSAYSRYGDYENAIKYLSESIASCPNSMVYAKTVNNTIGVCYRNLAKYDSAQRYFRLTYERALADDDTLWSDIELGNIGITYYYQKKFAEAIPLLETDIRSGILHHVLKNAVNSMYILASLYYERKELQKAEDLMTRAISISETKDFWHDYSLSEKLYRQMFKIFAAEHEPARAVAYADSTLVAMDSENSRNSAVAYAKAQERVEIEKKRLAAQKIESQKVFETLIKNSLIGGIILLTIIGVLFFNRQKLKQKKLLAEKMQAEFELEAAAVKLDNFRLSVLEKNEVIENYSNEIERMSKGTSEQNENEIIGRLEQSTLLTDEQWDNFRDLFEKVHPGFFAGLKKKLPDLTPAETRFLALTKLKLSSKEMASMLGISPNAIRIYRYRLRKKLGLDKDDMIEELIAGM